MKKISEIISFELPDGIKNLEVSDICDDSRKASEGCLFVAINGSLDDGKKYIDDAISRGAKYIVSNGEENHVTRNDSGITYIYVNNSRIELSHIASRFFPNNLNHVPRSLHNELFFARASKNVAQDRSVLDVHEDPSSGSDEANCEKEPLCSDLVIAVTGTNGKTSTVDMVHQIWTKCGHKSASIGTLGVVAPLAFSVSLPSEGCADCTSDVKAKVNACAAPPLTSPGPIQLHKILHDLSNVGVRNIAIEASSHGICQHRLDDVDFSVCAFTNLTQDHLDYHGTMEDYWKAKERLFSEVAGKNTIFVVNSDEGKYSKKILEIASARNIKCITYGRESNDIRIVSVVPGKPFLLVNASFWGQGIVFSLPIHGTFQAYNAICAAAICCATGIPIENIIDALENLRPIRGRMELVAKYRGRNIFLDYAHTPDALKNAIMSLGDHVITLFGCGGDRDLEKRKLMGEIAGELSDFVFVTDDNPRNEDPTAIRRMIIEGVLEKDKGKIIEIKTGRKDAIEIAMDFCIVGHCLLVAGKGHENYQQLANEMVYFSDRDVILNKAKGKGRKCKK
ncbi:UDP-N-acetylmuramoyl-L-alanyl-D-glutamate--2,6-diaminopimelate ligase [Alphaproteobacteria bacterium]|nr:UDP-N-acetylmuramoyl-L-alanyl-D-glutamate--2,6-diaminopimelate ligase [Alphaproteobacteria bacterium]